MEEPVAGGHDAPPRGGGETDPEGEPNYGCRNEVDPEKVRTLGLPFWLAGGSGRPGGLAAAREQGARGTQVGTLFANCRESPLVTSGDDVERLGSFLGGREEYTADHVLEYLLNGR